MKLSGDKLPFVFSSSRVRNSKGVDNIASKTNLYVVMGSITHFTLMSGKISAKMYAQEIYSKKAILSCPTSVTSQTNFPLDGRIDTALELYRVP